MMPPKGIQDGMALARTDANREASINLAIMAGMDRATNPGNSDFSAHYSEMAKELQVTP